MELHRDEGAVLDADVTPFVEVAGDRRTGWLRVDVIRGTIGR
jgi:hypothetical protein